MAPRKIKTPPTKPTSPSLRQPVENTPPLGITLPPTVSRRLAILTEDNDLETVLSEAVQLLWNRRYPRQPSLEEPPVPAADHPTEAPPMPEAAESTVAPDVVQPEAIPPAAIATEAASPVETPPAAATPEEKSGAPTPATDRQAIVDQVQAWQADGLSLTAIAARLNRENVPTLSGSGQWRHGTVRRLLHKAAASAVNS